MPSQNKAVKTCLSAGSYLTEVFEKEDIAKVSTHKTIASEKNCY
jgi:hypothetical protein